MGSNPRVGRCYELSAEYVVEHPELNAVLVHGSIQGGGYPRNPHAWVELEGGGIVHDPVMGWTVPAWVYESFCGTQVYVRYTLAETSKKLVETGTYGAWDDESEAALQARLKWTGERS